jgi:phage gpG-like protein
VEIEDAKAQEALSALAKRGTDLRPLMQELGEYLTETTKQRFQTSTAPDGSRWAPNAPATYLAYLGQSKGSFGKYGRMTKAGAARASGKKPLIGETRRLSSEIYYRADSRSVEIGSGLVYSAIHQFGGQAGRGKQVTIPARPYLGLSADDQNAIQMLAAGYLVGS